MITPLTFTGSPIKEVGENFACQAARTQTCCNIGWPETGLAEVTFPYSSMTTWTTTVPAALAARASAGYSGFGRLMALPLSTPPEIGARLADWGFAGSTLFSSALSVAPSIPMRVSGFAGLGVATGSRSVSF